VTVVSPPARTQRGVSIGWCFNSDVNCAPTARVSPVSLLE
jgi:hypothetical protein